MIQINGEVHSSKNSRRIMRNQKTGLPFVAKSKQSKADETSFALQLASQFGHWREMIDDCDFPLTIVFTFRRGSRRRFDYVNIAQGVLDAMVKAGYIPDDSADYVIPAFMPYQICKNPGCDIAVKKG